MEHYGLKLRKLREDKGLSQTQCAKMMEIPQTTLSNIERNHSPQIDVIANYIKKVAPELPLYRFFLNDTDFKNITGVDPRWVTIAQLVEHMPEDIQVKIMENVLQIVEMMQSTLDQYRQNMEKSLEGRGSL
jgi:transcriptional regulator with XRE-family HTH domain